MKLKNLFDNDTDRAVSPVIGVILMVAITVILAAVIGTFVLGLGDQVQQSSPNVNFAFDYNGTALEVTHTGGDGIDAGELRLTGDGTNIPATWDTLSGDHSENSRVRAGDSVTVSGPSDSGTVRVVWEDSDSDRSSTLRTWTGPDA